MTVEFTAEERVWIRLKWKQVRTASAKADELNNKWLQINDELNYYLARSLITDPVQTAKIKNESLALADAFASGKWHAANASRHCDDIQTFLKLREMGVL